MVKKQAENVPGAGVGVGPGVGPGAGVAMAAAVVAAVTVVVAGCAGPGSPFPRGTLAYGFPSPPNAAYEIADTVLVTVKTTGPDVETAGGFAQTLDLRFERDPGGVRVRGIMAAIQGSLWDPGTPSERRPGRWNPAGTHHFVINRHGVSEVRSFPALSGQPALLFSLVGHAHDIFPRLPGTVPDPGGTWADTVRWHVDHPDAEVTYRSAFSYTLVGDTVVDGRTLVRIAADADLATVTVTGTPGNATYRVLNGPVTGLVLWDPERTLVAYAQYERDLVGTLQRPDRPMLGMTLEGRATFQLKR